MKRDVKKLNKYIKICYRWVNFYFFTWYKNIYSCCNFKYSLLSLAKESDVVYSETRTINQLWLKTNSG